jgi:hypothetical protein
MLLTTLTKMVHQDRACIIKTISKFLMRNLGLLTLYVVIELKQSPGVTTLKQTAFAGNLLEKAGYNVAHVQMELCLELSKERSNTHVNVTLYRSIVGSLHTWCSRGQISRSASFR